MAQDISTPGIKSLIAVTKSDHAMKVLREFCDQATGIKPDIRQSDDPLANASEFINGGGDVVVLEAGLIDDNGIEALEQLCTHVTRGGSFIVLAEEPPLSLVRRLFQAGVTDVVPTPLDETEFISALRKALNARAKDTSGTDSLQKPGVVLTALKTTGGVGATTVAVNLATEIRRQFDASVALVDFDIQFGNMHLALDIEPRMSLIEAISAGDRLDTTLLKATMTRHKSGVDLLASPPDITPLDAVDDTFVCSALKMVRDSYDVTIIEPPACWSQWTRTILAQSDLIMPVLQPDVRSGAGAVRMMRCFQDLDLYKPPLFTIANKTEKGFATNDRLDRLKEITGRKADAILSIDGATANEASDCGVPIRKIAPKSQLARDYEKLASKAVSRLGLEFELTAPPPSRKGISLGSLRLRGGE